MTRFLTAGGRGSKLRFKGSFEDDEALVAEQVLLGKPTNSQFTFSLPTSLPRLLRLIPILAKAEAAADGGRLSASHMTVSGSQRVSTSQPLLY